MSAYNDVTFSLMLDFLAQAGAPHFNLSLTDIIAAVATEQALHTTQVVPTSDTAINLGPIANPQFFAAINRDPTNFIEIKTGSAGKVVAKLLPGLGCFLPLGSDMLAPYAKANTAAVALEYLIISL